MRTVVSLAALHTLTKLVGSTPETFVVVFFIAGFTFAVAQDVVDLIIGVRKMIASEAK